MIGPTVIPFRNLSGRYEGVPHRPADFGRYLPIDLDENNRAAIEAWRERNPGKTPPSLGWGVCRHGFGLQNLPRMTEDEAERVAVELNAITPTAEREAFCNTPCTACGSINVENNHCVCCGRARAIVSAT
jgi:hypothetical protein